MTSEGWPPDWRDRVSGKDCPMCAQLMSGEYARVAVFDGEHGVAILAKRSRLRGYCEVIWKHNHVAEPSELDQNAAAGYWRDVVTVGRAIEGAFRPIKVNYMTLGNWVPHLHTHVVPRYADDPAPGGPIAWHAMFQDEQLSVERLEEDAAELKKFL